LEYDRLARETTPTDDATDHEEHHD
jgi:hypothetical protein